MLGEGFPGSKLKLFDEEIAAGVLTQAAGEPAVVQSVDEESFEGAQLVLFAGTPDFAARHAAAALQGGQSVIDLSGGLRDRQDARLWIPSLDSILQARDEDGESPGKVFLSPSAPVIIACAFAAALSPWAVSGASMVFMQPVSERGQEGIEELERQTVSLLSFQPIAKPVFDAQVAFNLMDRFGDASSRTLAAARGAIARDVATYLGERTAVPAIQLLQAPVFHSHAFTIFAMMEGSPDPAEIEQALAAAGFQFPEGDQNAPSAISAAGASQPLLGHVERDPNHASGYWFWGAADNLRMSAVNALAIAQRVLESPEDE